jgi:hypothetical protein
MTEKFLHYLWKTRLLHFQKLKTSAGESLQVLSCGEYNTDAGPDFLNARVRIGGTLWAGNVEIHLRSSDWNAHQHQSDKAYDNIILHVVHEEDQQICRTDGSPIPSVAIRNCYDRSVYETYQSLMQSTSGIPCGVHLKEVDSLIIKQWIERLLVERLEEKIQPILSTLAENEHNWEETFYQVIAQSYGAKLNAVPFLLLARAIPMKILAKHKNNLFQLEALLFGTAGFLDESFSDDYPNQLQKEFNFLKQKHKLQPLKKHIWKFLRLRPAGFPTIRLAQFAQLIFQSSHLFSKIMETSDAINPEFLFESEASAYWKNHYYFEKTSVMSNKHFGKIAIELLLINTIAPFMFVYGKSKDDEHLINRAMELLMQVTAERNKIIQQWKKMGLHAKSAFDSQALIQLTNKYCKNYRCLECSIGHQVLSKGS